MDHLKDPNAIDHPEHPTNLDLGASVAGNAASDTERMEHPLRLFLSAHGVSVMEMIGRHDQGILRLREVTSTMRWGAAFAYDRAWPEPRQPVPEDSAEEETDSGLPSSSEETGIPWSSLHARFNNSPVYRPGQVEEAYELWLMCRRPFGREFDRVLASRGLMEIEIRALRAAIEYYYMSSPKSSGSATPSPPTLESEVQPAQTEHVDFIIDRMIGDGEILVDRDGSIWAGPLRPSELGPCSRADPASSSSDPVPVQPTRRVTRRDWGLLVTEEEGEISDMQRHDQIVAEAVFTLYLEGYDFDVQQLSSEQLELFHSMVGRYMSSLHEVD